MTLVDHSETNFRNLFDFIFFFT